MRPVKTVDLASVEKIYDFAMFFHRIPNPRSYMSMMFHNYVHNYTKLLSLYADS